MPHRSIEEDHARDKTKAEGVDSTFRLNRHGNSGEILAGLAARRTHNTICGYQSHIVRLHEHAAGTTQTVGIEIGPGVLPANGDGWAGIDWVRLQRLNRRIGTDLLRQSRQSNKTRGRNCGYSYGVKNLDHRTVPVRNLRRQ
jgi:hypothetical protein